MANRWRANKSVIHSPTCSTWIRGVTPPALVITGTLIRIIDDEIEHPGQQNWRPRNPLRARHQSGVPTLRATHVAAVSGRATNTRKESRMPVILLCLQHDGHATFFSCIGRASGDSCNMSCPQCGHARLMSCAKRVAWAPVLLPGVFDFIVDYSYKGAGYNQSRGVTPRIQVEQVGECITLLLARQRFAIGNFLHNSSPHFFCVNECARANA